MGRLTRSRYRIFDTEYAYFLTSTILGWLPVFTHQHYVQTAEKRSLRAPIPHGGVLPGRPRGSQCRCTRLPGVTASFSD
jgi:hypothetical protein